MKLKRDIRLCPKIEFLVKLGNIVIISCQYALGCLRFQRFL